MDEDRKEEVLGVEIKKRIIGYIVAASGLVAGLAWNDAIKSMIEYLFPLEKNTLAIKFIYAVIITVIVVMVTVYLARIIKKYDK